MLENHGSQTLAKRARRGAAGEAANAAPGGARDPGLRGGAVIEVQALDACTSFARRGGGAAPDFDIGEAGGRSRQRAKAPKALPPGRSPLSK